MKYIAKLTSFAILTATISNAGMTVDEFSSQPTPPQVKVSIIKEVEPVIKKDITASEETIPTKEAIAPTETTPFIEEKGGMEAPDPTAEADSNIPAKIKQEVKDIPEVKAVETVIEEIPEVEPPKLQAKKKKIRAPKKPKLVATKKINNEVKEVPEIKVVETVVEDIPEVAPPKPLVLETPKVDVAEKIETNQPVETKEKDVAKSVKADAKPKKIAKSRKRKTKAKKVAKSTEGKEIIAESTPKKELTPKEVLNNMEAEAIPVKKIKLDKKLKAKSDARKYGFFAALGQGDGDVKSAAIGFDLYSEMTWFDEGNWYLTPYTEVLASYWEGDSGHTGVNTLHEGAVSVYGRFIRQKYEKLNLSPYFDIGLGLHYITEDRIAGKELGRQWLAGSNLGIGLVLGKSEVFDIGLRIRHLSNAGTEELNWGINHAILRLAIRF